MAPEGQMIDLGISLCCLFDFCFDVSELVGRECDLDVNETNGGYPCATSDCRLVHECATWLISILIFLGDRNECTKSEIETGDFQVSPADDFNHDVVLFSRFLRLHRCTNDDGNGLEHRAGSGD